MPRTVTIFVSIAVGYLFSIGVWSGGVSEGRLSIDVVQPTTPQETTSAIDYDKKLAELGIVLPKPSASIAIYKSVVVVDNIAYLAGHIPRTAEGEIMRGKVGDNITLEQAQVAAKRSAIAMLASLKAELGTLNRVKRLVKTTGMVNCTPDFTDQSKVINGCSELLRDLFGQENGVGARAAVGMSSLPVGAIVEIEAIFELTDGEN